MQDLCRKILAANFTIPDHVSPAARDLLLRMLTVDPARRITLPEVRALKKQSLLPVPADRSGAGQLSTLYSDLCSAGPACAWYCVRCKPLQLC